MVTARTLVSLEFITESYYTDTTVAKGLEELLPRLTEVHGGRGHLRLRLSSHIRV